MTKPSILGLITGCAIGLSIAAKAATSYGYYAPSWLALAFVITLGSLALSGFLLLFRRTRPLTRPIAVAGIVVTISCWCAIAVLSGLGVWQDGSTMRSLAAEFSPASRVIIFRENAQNADINRFLDSVLSVPHATAGHSLRYPQIGRMRVHVEGHDGYALIFDPAADAAEVAALDQEIERHPLVLRVFRDVNPREIRLNQD